MKTAIAMFGGATALALAVGFGGLGSGPAGGVPTVTHPVSSVTPTLGGGPASVAHEAVHHVILAGCISGLDC